jgi:hypothetical protein
MPRSKKSVSPAPDADDDKEALDRAASMSNLPAEVFQKHYREIRTLKRKIDEATSLYRTARKRAGTDGVDLKALAVMEKLSKLDDGDADALLNKVYRYAGWVSLPIGTQITLFDADAEPTKVEADDEHRQWAASEAGIASGKGGGLREDNPFPEGSPLYDRWDRGFLEGLEALAAGMGKDRKKAPTNKQRAEPPKATDINAAAAGTA